MDENVNEITQRLDGLVEAIAALEKRQRTKPTPKPGDEVSKRTVARVVGTVLVVLVLAGAVLAAWYWALQYGIVLPR